MIAGVRSEKDATAITKVDPQRVSAVILDITNADDIAKLADALPKRLDAVVNNAGVAVGGPVETVTPDDWRNVLEVNVIGQFAVTRAILPRLRESRGRVLFISSVNGRIATPMLGPYSASKFALEAGCDALRVELKAWDIPVVLIEPAQTDTDMWRTAGDMVLQIEEDMSPEHRELYAKHLAGMKRPDGPEDGVADDQGGGRRGGGADGATAEGPLLGGATAQGAGRCGAESADGAA